jgi:uncharacterized protein
MKNLFSGLVIFSICVCGCNTSNPTTVEFNPIKPGQVTLKDGPFRIAYELNRIYLNQVVPDKLIANFRKTAGLEVRIPAYRGWEDHELRGHFLGHYLSACAMVCSTTGDSILQYRTQYLVKQLKKCQEAYGNGYVSAFPEEFFDRVENLNQVWAPYYTQHKIMAGLLDCYQLMGDTLALEVLRGMADWLDNRCKNISHDRMQKILNQTEQGGINEVLFNLYSVTQEPRYLRLAQKFFRESYFKPLAANRDSLTGQTPHAIIPVVTGIAREFEVDGDSSRRDMAREFWQEVAGNRTFITGGTGNKDHWNSIPGKISCDIGLETHEFCNTYNLLKLTSHLFSWDHSMKYADYIEKLLWNAILPAQQPFTGVTGYYLPMAPGNYKTYSSTEKSFWCTTGTGIESYARTALEIYSSQGNQLYVNQFIASELDIPEKGLSLYQNTVFPKEASTSFVFTLKRPLVFDLMLRIPAWIKGQATITINGKTIDDKLVPGTYFKLSRKWKNGDRVILNLPMNLLLVPVQDNPTMASFVEGPLVLAAALSDKGISAAETDNMFASYQNDFQDIPVILAKTSEPGSWTTPTNQVSIRVPVKGGTTVDFIPFYELINHRYMVYFPVEFERNK